MKHVGLPISLSSGMLIYIANALGEFYGIDI